MISNFLALVINTELTHAVMEQDGYLVTGDLEGYMPILANSYFYSPMARAWLDLNAEWIRSYSPEYFDALVREMEKIPAVDSDTYLEAMRSGAVPEKAN